jgi:outer membrane protein assembly factor BamB
VLGFGDANFAAMGDSLVSIDRQTGQERWVVELPGDLRRQGGALAPPPAAAGEHLVVATITGEVLVVNPTNGDISRRLQVGAPVRSQPAVDRGWIYVGTTDGQLVGLNTGDSTLSGWPTWAGNPARTGAQAR